MLAGLLLSSSTFLVGITEVHADPLVPLTPGENEYLAQIHRIMPGTGDREAFKSDGELLDRGRYACYKRDVNGQVGYHATYVSPIITQLAFIYLCPK